MNRNALIYKLFKRNVSGKLLNLINVCFQNKKTRVNWRNEFSLPFKSFFGVIQGGVLGPQLGNEFLSDLGDYLDPEC